MQTVAYILGIPYPTGYPGYVLLGWLWSHAFAVGSVAWRINLLSALATAATAGTVTAIARTVGANVAIAVGAGFVYGFAGAPWMHATYADVHPLGDLFAAVALLYALRWVRDGVLGDAVRTILAAAVGLAIDNTTVLLLPGIAVVAFGRRPGGRPVLLALGAGLAIVIAAYAYLPLRSATVTAQRLDPTLALGVPPGRPFWDDHHPAELTGFVRLVAGSDFAPGRAASRMLSSDAARLATDFAPAAQRDLGEVLLWLALFGVLAWWWRDRRAPVGVVLFGLCPLLFIFAYPAESDVARYFLPAYVTLAVAAAYGAQTLVAVVRPPLSLALAASGAVWFCALLAGDVVANRQLFDQPADRGAEEFVDRVATLTPPNAIVVVKWLYATPLAYGAFVEHRLGDRIVVTGLPEEYRADFPRWVRERPVVVIADEAPSIPGFALRDLDPTGPHLYLLQPAVSK